MQVRVDRVQLKWQRSRFAIQSVAQSLMTETRIPLQPSKKEPNHGRDIRTAHRDFAKCGATLRAREACSYKPYRPTTGAFGGMHNRLSVVMPDTKRRVVNRSPSRDQPTCSPAR